MSSLILYKHTRLWRLQSNTEAAQRQCLFELIATGGKNFEKYFPHFLTTSTPQAKSFLKFLYIGEIRNKSNKIWLCYIRNTIEIYLCAAGKKNVNQPRWKGFLVWRKFFFMRGKKMVSKSWGGNFPPHGGIKKTLVLPLTHHTLCFICSK